jgi:HTH-like domain
VRTRSPPVICARPTPRSGTSSVRSVSRPWKSRSCARPRVVKKRCRCAESPGDPVLHEGDLHGPRHGQAHALLHPPARPIGRYHRTADATVLQQIRAVTNSRATYGYRRVWAMVNGTFRAGYNRKRIRRVMQLHGPMLAPRVHRRHGRPHVDQIQRPASKPALVLGRLPDPLLEQRGALGGLRDRRP